MIPQISNRPPKATSAELDTGTNDSKYVTPLSLANSKLALPPTDLKISTASKSGVLRNIDKATGDTAVTANGWIEDAKYRWYMYKDASAVSAEFDSAVTRTGKFTLKLEATDATGKISAYTYATADVPGLSKYTFPLKISTIYKLSCWVKTNNVPADAVFVSVIQNDSAGVAGTTVDSNKLTGTNDWTLCTVTFTSDNNAVYGRIRLRDSTAGNVNQAWFDVNSMTLEEVVTDTSFTGKVAEKVRPVLQAVTSTNNIDQSLDPTGAYANTYALTNAVNEGATHIQTFTPTKKYTTQIGVWIVEAGTSVTWTLTVHTAGNVVVASQLIVAASLVEGAFNYFSVPNIWTTGALHFHLFASATTGTPTCKANGADDLETASYIQRYAKKSEGFTLISNGIKTELKSDKDGLLTGAVIDLDNGKYGYSLKDFVNRSGDFFSASAGGRLLTNAIINDWYLNSSSVMNSKNDAVDRNIVIKVNTILPIKHLKFTPRYGCFGGGTATFEISSDNVTYTTIHTQTASVANDPASVSIETDLVNGLSVFYIKLHKASSVSDYFVIGSQIVEADLDTSSIPSGLLYPIATNQFTETVKLPAVATRIYYRLNKFTNEYGVVVPCLEYTDASAVNIGYTPLKLDNSQETNPSVALVVASTTNGQNSGTGSLEGANYILNDGEYMTLSTAVAEISVTYLVGKGTTAFTNITKNTLFLSSNAESSDPTQDPSHQANFIVGARQQGLTDRVKDVGDEIAYVKYNKPFHIDIFSKEWYIPSLPSLATTGLGRPMPMTKDGKINYVNVTLNGIISSPSIYFDINKNFTSIFETATRPLITNGTFASTASIYTNTFVKGDIFSVDYDFGGNSKDAIVTIVGE